MKERLIKFIIDFEIVYDKFLSGFHFDPIFGNSLYKLREKLKKYFFDTFLILKKTLTNKSFGMELFINKELNMVSNIILLLFFAPVFRMIIIIGNSIYLTSYGLYALFVNHMFDLIKDYINLYAKKMGVFYDSVLVSEIEYLRKITLFIGVKQNFLAIFKSEKDIIIDGLIYKGNIIQRGKRIFMGLILFFIWPLPILFSFASYLIRLLFSLIKSYCKIVFFFFARIFIKRIRRLYFSRIFHIIAKYCKLKIGIRTRFRRARRYTFRAKKIPRVDKNLMIIKDSIAKIYDNVSYFFRRRNRLSRLEMKKLMKLRKKYGGAFDALKRNKVEFKHLVIRNKELYGLNEKFFINKASKINFFNIIKNVLDDKIISKLDFVQNSLERLDNKYNKHDNRYIYYYLLFKRGTLLHILNHYSMNSFINFFIGSNINIKDYNGKSYKFTFFKHLKLPWLKMKFLYKYYIYYNVILTLHVIFAGLYFQIRTHLYLFISVLYYFFRCILHFILLFVKFFYGVFMLFFITIKLKIKSFG